MLLQNYLTVGIRALTKNVSYAVINVLGLAIGMAACLLILLYVRYELSYERWLPNAGDTYQLQSWYDVKSTGETMRLQMTPYVAGKRLAKDFPAIKGEVYAFSTEPIMMAQGVATKLEDFIYTDGNLLNVVELPLLAGRREALDRVGGAAISRSEAVRRFGTDQALGRTLTVISRGKARDFLIGAVFADLPKNSHIEANVVARIDYAAWMADTPRGLDCWGCQNGFVYVRLRPGADPQAITAGLPAWEKRNIPDENAGGMRTNAGDDQDWKLVALEDVHLGDGQEGAMSPGNDRGTIVTFAVIAALILAMAIVNFVNLTTARASQRAREVALRKVLGANRRQLVAQFIGESVLVAGVAMVIALALVELALPAFAAFLDADLRVGYLGVDGVGLPVLGLVLIAGVLGGLYPALFMSRFQPAAVLKANRSAAETPGSGRLRQALVVAQFAISIGLIICTAVVYAQTVYARSVDPGFDRSRILQLDELSRYQLIGKGRAIADAVARVPGVEAVGRTGLGIATPNNSTTGFAVPGRSQPVSIDHYAVDEGFLKAIGLKLVAGRWFDPARPADDATMPYPPSPEAQQALARRGVNIVVNELAARRLGFNDPAAAVGKTFRAGYVDTEYGLVPATIVGVVGDARFRSIREPLEPISYTSERDGVHQNLIVRYRGNPAEVRKGVEAAWRRIAPDVPFAGEFSEEIVAELYDAEAARATTFAGFAALAVIVACLGLFGLASFTAERRTKEIGIRKVLGARTRDIVRLLVWQFSRPVLLANLIAWPLSWWVLRDWLDGFDARIALNPLYFVAAGVIALTIAVATIGGHAFRVARANPVKALRYE